MKKVKIIATICIAVLIACPVIIAAATKYNSSEDPFITFSYLDKIFKADVIDDVINELEERNLINGAETETVSSAVSAQYTVEHLYAGQRIEALSSCEVILRSGRAQALVTDEANIANKVGLSNITSGTEILNGESVPLNNCIIIPRADGRAVLTMSQDAYFMVRGEYRIVDLEQS